MTPIPRLHVTNFWCPTHPTTGPWQTNHSLKEDKVNKVELVAVDVLVEEVGEGPAILSRQNIIFPPLPSLCLRQSLVKQLTLHTQSKVF